MIFVSSKKIKNVKVHATGVQSWLKRLDWCSNTTHTVFGFTTKKNEIIDNDNPPEWDDDKKLTDAFMAVSDLYDTFFIDNKQEFRYVGCKDEKILQQLNEAVAHAVKILMEKK